jgi:hypothetical protein
MVPITYVIPGEPRAKREGEGREPRYFRLSRCLQSGSFARCRYEPLAPCRGARPGMTSELLPSVLRPVGSKSSRLRIGDYALCMTALVTILNNSSASFVQPCPPCSAVSCLCSGALEVA